MSELVAFLLLDDVVGLIFIFSSSGIDSLLILFAEVFCLKFSKVPKRNFAAR
jgi:hypothetical protein